MKHIFSKISSLLLVMCLVFTNISSTVYAADISFDTEQETLESTEENSVVEEETIEETEGDTEEEETQTEILPSEDKALEEEPSEDITPSDETVPEEEETTPKGNVPEEEETIPEGIVTEEEETTSEKIVKEEIESVQPDSIDVENITELTLGESYPAAGNQGESVYFHFKAEKAGTFIFSSFNQEETDPYCLLYDSNGNFVNSFDDNLLNNNIQVLKDYNEEDEFYYQVRGFGERAFSCNVKIVELTEDYNVRVKDLVRYEGDTSKSGTNIWDEESGKEIYVEYPVYDVRPKEIIVTTSDGENFTGTLDNMAEPLYEILGYWPEYSYTSDQSYDNLWEIGTHTATFTLVNKKCEYNVIIQENPITSVTVAEIIKYEGETDTVSDYVYIDGEYVYVEYQRYNITPKEITVTTSDGKTYTGDPYEVRDQLKEVYDHSFIFDYTSDQSYENQWGLGTHTAKFTFGGRGCDYTVIVKENPIASVSVADLIKYEGETYTTSTWIDIDGVSTRVEYQIYDVEPREITVTTSDGKTYTGEPYEVREQIKEVYDYWFGFNYDSDQSYENQWGLGTHTATFTFGKKSYEYNVFVKENPITSVKVQDVIRYEGDTETVGDIIYVDGNEVYVEYQRYDIQPQEITITTSDGKTYTGYLYDVGNQLNEIYDHSFAYNYNSDQSYENQWGVGSHKATFTFGSKDCEYNVIVRENPIISIEIPDVIKYEGESYTDTYYYFVDGEEFSVEYQVYDIASSEITVTTSDGKTYTGDAYDVERQLAEIYDHWFGYYYHSDQSYENQWGVGTHTATLTFGSKSFDYKVIIKENPISSIEVPDVIKNEGDTYTTVEYHYEDGEEIRIEYQKYSVYPQEIIVTTIDGETYTGDPDDIEYQLYEIYDHWFGYDYDSDQSYENQWGVGTHKAIFTFGGRKCEYNVIINESPIISVSVEDVIKYEGDSYKTTDYIEEEDIYVEYQVYDIDPQKITVTTSDGETYTGDPYEVRDQLREFYNYPFDYSYDSDQSYYNQWGVGTHTATFTIGGKSCEYNVIIQENPITSVEVTDVIRYEGETFTTSTYITVDGEDVLVEYQVYSANPQEITVITSDGKSYTGSPEDVRDQIGRDYDYWINSYYDENDQSYYNQWGVGTHTATFIFGYRTCEYNVIILENPITSLDVTDLIKYEGDTYTSTDYINVDGEWITVYYQEYETYPREITVTMADGKIYTGDPYDVRSMLRDEFGRWFYSSYGSNQSYYNQWGVGTHTATFSLGGRSCEYNVIVKANPIVSVSVTDVIRYEAEGYTVSDWVDIDGEAVQVEYKIYSIDPQEITVTTIDGKTYTGDIYSVRSSLNYDYNNWFNYSYSSDQAYNNEWGLGTHTATFTFGGKNYDYNVIIKENPIVSVSVADVIRYESNSYLTYETIYVDGEPIQVEYRKYYIDPEEITVTTSDGKTYTGLPYNVQDELYKKYGRRFDYFYSSNQSYENQWGVGTYTAGFGIAWVGCSYNVIIKEDPTIASVVAEDNKLYADQYYTDYAIIPDEETGGNSVIEYKRYSAYPSFITVTTVDGEVFSGQFYEVVNKFGQAVPYNIYTDQAYDNEWGIGVHSATLTLGDVSCDYKVTITEPLVKAVSVEKIIRYKRDATTGYYYNPDGTYNTYTLYIAQPEKITVETSDGNTFSDDFYKVFDSMFDQYGFYPSWRWDSYQSPDNEWGIGDHLCDFRFGFATTKYTVSVIPAKATRLYGNLRFDTSFLIADTLKDVLKTDKFDNVIIASSSGFADALAGSYLAARKNAPILLTSDKDNRIQNVVNYIKNNLKAGGNVYILGGTAAVPDKVETALKGVNCKITRLAGALRYDTNRAILEEVGVDRNAEILVSTGSNFADSLSASATGLPILLVSDNNLKKESTVAYLKSLKEKNVRFTILGGTSAVSEEAEKILSQYGYVRRIAGDTRFATSTNIATNYFSQPENVVLAYSQNFPDGLCVGPLAYNLKAPLLLTRDRNASIAADYIVKNSKLHHGYAIGGPTLISDTSLVNIFELTKASDIEVVYRK